jgi:hypothetical protein
MMAYPLECDIAFIDGAMQTPLQSCEPDFGTYLWCSDLLELDTDNSCNVPAPNCSAESESRRSQTTS